MFLAKPSFSPPISPPLSPHHCSQDRLGNLRSRRPYIGTDVNKKPTQHGKAGLLRPEESLCVEPSALLHAAPDHDGVSVDGVDNVDSVNDGVVELAHVLGTADLRSLIIASILADQAGI